MCERVKARPWQGEGEVAAARDQIANSQSIWGGTLVVAQTHTNTHDGPWRMETVCAGPKRGSWRTRLGSSRRMRKAQRMTAASEGGWGRQREVILYAQDS